MMSKPYSQPGENPTDTNQASEDELKVGYIKVTLNYAPKTNGKKFDKWCDDNGFTPMNGGRRAWSSSLSTYLRDADGVAYADGEPFLFYEEDLVDIESLIRTEKLKLLAEVRERKAMTTPENKGQEEFDEKLDDLLYDAFGFTRQNGDKVMNAMHFDKAAKLKAGLKRLFEQELEARVREAEERGASIAASAINHEIGVEMTLNGSYYLDRHARGLAPLSQPTNTKGENGSE
jgi:hypothetical protein